MKNELKISLKSIIEILKLGEKLKMELRHSWLSNGRQESVAEHTWRMSLMALLLEPILPAEIDKLKLLKMIIIHDLVEAEAGDVSVLDQIRDPTIKELKKEREEVAIENIKNILLDLNGEEIYTLFYEFENKETLEAKIANAIDKLEVQLQHNHADLDTWEEIEYSLTYLIDKHVSFNNTLTELKDVIVSEAEEKMLEFGLNIQEIKDKAKSI